MAGTNAIRQFFILVLLLIVSGVGVNGQVFKSKDQLHKSDNSLIRIPLTERAEDDKIAKSLAICPVYKFQSDSIEPFTMFGVETKNEPEPLVIRKMPEMIDIRDTGYTYLYFSGANSIYNQGYILTLIGNYKKSRKTIYFYIDRNNNLDFTDDGPPVELPYMELSVVIKLNNTSQPECEYQVQLTRVQNESYQYKTLLTEHFTKHQGNKKFTHINYCYREQRLNTISGHYNNGTDSFTVALKDLNVNGIFNEECVDKFYVGKYVQKVYTDEMIYLMADRDQTSFEWNRKLYRLVNVDPSGKFIEIEQVHGTPLKKKLKVGKKIPKFEYIDTDRETRKIRNFRRSELYIFFYDMEHLTAEDTLYLGMIHRQYSNEIKVVTLNHGDNPNSVYSNQYYNHIHWPMGFSSYYIGLKFKLEELPRGFYVGKRLRLKKERVSPKQMYELLSVE